MKKFIISLIVSFGILFIIRFYFWGYVVYYVIKWYDPKDWFQVFLAIFLLLMLALIIKRIRHKLYAPIGIVLGMLIVFSIDALSDNCIPKKYIFDDYRRKGNCLIKEDGRKAYLLDKKQNVIIESVKYEEYPEFFTFIDKETLQDSYGYIHNEYDETDDGLSYQIRQLYLYDESYKLYAIYEIETAYDGDYIEHNKSLYGDDWDIKESDCKEIESTNDIIERFFGKITSSYNLGNSRCWVFLDINLVSTKRDNEPVNSKKVRNDEEDSDSTSEKHSSNTNYEPEYGLRDEWVDCMTCHGSGECPYCHGEGRDFVTNYSGDILSVADCNICFGSGVCQSCAGTRGHYEKRQYQIR